MLTSAHGHGSRRHKCSHVLATMAAKGEVPSFARQNTNIYCIASFFDRQMAFPILQAMEEAASQHSYWEATVTVTLIGKPL